MVTLKGNLAWHSNPADNEVVDSANIFTDTNTFNENVVVVGGIINDALKTAVDGYSSSIALRETIVSHNADMVLVRSACDGYTGATDLSSRETVVDHNADMVLVRSACDGYIGTSSISGFANKVDGYFTSSAASAITACGVTVTPEHAAFYIVPQNAAPSVPKLGDFYVDSNTLKVFFYNGSTWIDLTLSA